MPSLPRRVATAEVVLEGNGGIQYLRASILLARFGLARFAGTVDTPKRRAATLPGASGASV
jgi:hypothetical protein